MIFPFRRTGFPLWLGRFRGDIPGLTFSTTIFILDFGFFLFTAAAVVLLVLSNGFSLEWFTIRPVLVSPILFLISNIRWIKDKLELLQLKAIVFLFSHATLSRLPFSRTPHGPAYHSLSLSLVLILSL